MTFIATHTLSLRAQTLIATIARIDRLGGDILDGDTCHEPGDIPKLGVLLDEQAFDWSKERLGEGISVLADDAMSALVSKLNANIEREEQASTSEACRVYHAEIQYGAR
jgi:hypothetical protein